MRWLTEINGRLTGLLRTMTPKQLLLDQLELAQYARIPLMSVSRLTGGRLRQRSILGVQGKVIIMRTGRGHRPCLRDSTG